MKKTINMICSAAVLCGAFSMPGIKTYAEETTSVPEVTNIVSSEKITLDVTKPIVTETTSGGGTVTPDDLSKEVIEKLGIPLGNGILLEDKNNDVVDRQFLTVQSKNGNTFYLIVDKDSTGKENVYFLNIVDEYDLMAFAEDVPKDAEWEFGVTDKDKAPDVTDKNQKSVEGTEDKKEKSDDNQTKPKNNAINTLLFLIFFLLVGGGALYYFKIYKGKKNSNSKKISYDEDDEYEDELDDVLVNEDKEDE